MKSSKYNIIFLALIFCIIYPFNIHAQELDITKFDKSKILEVMEQIVTIDFARPGFTGDSQKFVKENSNLNGQFSDATITVDNGYYGIAGGLHRTINLTYSKLGILATYGGASIINIKTSYPLTVIVSGGSNKYKVEKTGGFNGPVYFITHFSQGTIEGSTRQISFKDFWKQYRTKTQ